MNKKLEEAVLRLRANAYAPTREGQNRRTSDIVVLVSSTKDVPADAARWRWLRERLQLTALHNLLARKFLAPDKAYVDEIDHTLDKIIASWRPGDDK